MLLQALITNNLQPNAPRHRALGTTILALLCVHVAGQVGVPKWKQCVDRKLPTYRSNENVDSFYRNPDYYKARPLYWELNEALLCRDSQQNDAISYAQCPGDNIFAPDQDCAFEFESIDPLKPIRPPGWTATEAQHIVACDIRRKQECWQTRTQDTAPVSPANIARLIEHHCQHEQTVADRHGNYPTTCHPAVSSFQQGCALKNANRPCFIEVGAPYFVFVFYPWLL